MVWISSVALTQVDCWHTYHHSKVVVLLVMLPSIFAFTLICFYFNLRKNLHFSIFIISFMLNVVEGLIAKIHCFFYFVQLGSPSVSVFNKNGLDIQFSFDTSKLQTTNSILITMAATNSLMSPMTNFVFQAAVPKVSFFLLFSNPQFLNWNRLEDCNTSS